MNTSTPLSIVFLCGSLEPGQDGVGDYTRRLACELIRKGHRVALIALNDKAVTDLYKGIQIDADTTIEVLRLPATDALNTRLNTAAQFMAKFNPEWLSLQFVPFAFNDKGLPFGFAAHLKKLGVGKKWHIMFHELWVAMEETATFKHKIWGWLQQSIISKLIKTLKPQAVHTQTQLYIQQLKNKGIAAKHLPLFGNIPLAGQYASKPVQHSPGSIINLVLFGGIHHGAPVSQFAQTVVNCAKKYDVNFKLILLGRSGNDQKRWADEFAAHQIQVEVLGEQPANVISQQLSSSTIGISTTPISLIEKSGTVAAMQEHGLPVICISREWKPRGNFDVPNIAGIYPYNSEVFETIFSNTLPVAANSVTSVADKFLAALN